MHDSDHNSFHIKHDKEVVVRVQLHSSYNQTKYIGEEEIINKTSSTYVEPLLNYSNRPILLQEWRTNIDAPAYGNN